MSSTLNEQKIVGHIIVKWNNLTNCFQPFGEGAFSFKYPDHGKDLLANLNLAQSHKDYPDRAVFKLAKIVLVEDEEG